ncbi:MAG: aminotransferase class V-fold PLP-dependent enzyme [Candidatus Saccharimonadales bacterium]|jgi:selenocysteine lyase/cysteine desulfurase
MCEPAYTAVREFLDEFYAVGPPEVLYKYDPMANDLAAEVAKLLNCSPDEVTYIKNTTEGVFLASETLPLDSGDEVLVLGNEYPANLLPWLKKRKDGVDVKVIKGKDNVQAFQALLAAINPKTKAVSISSTQYYDGFMLDLDLLSHTCRENGTYLVVDAVQTVGNRKIDLEKTPVDILVCGAQKYLRAGTGIGFMYVNKKIMPELRDIKVGIRSMQSFDEDSYLLKDSAAHFQDGTQNLPGIVGLLASLRSLNEVGIETIEAKNLQLLAEIKAILTRHGIPFIDHGDHQGNIVSLKVSDPKALFERLKAQNAYIKPIHDIARISFVHDINLGDVERIATLIEAWMRSNQ